MSHKCFNGLNSCVGHKNNGFKSETVNLDAYAEILNTVLSLYAQGGGSEEVPSVSEFWEAFNTENPAIVCFTNPAMGVQISTQNVTRARNGSTKAVGQLTAVFDLYTGTCNRISVTFNSLTITEASGSETEIIKITVNVESLGATT